MEQAEILQGAIETGTALYTHGVNANSLVEAFRIVLEGLDGEMEDWREIHFVRVDNDANDEEGEAEGDEVYCTMNYTPDNPTQSASIACDLDVVMTQYTAVHEFGHVFDRRTGSAFRLLVEDPNVLHQLRNSDNAFVMGRRGYNRVGGGDPGDWQRSDVDTDNGWGSAALWNEQSYWVHTMS